MLIGIVHMANHRSGKTIFPSSLFQSNSDKIDKILLEKKSVYLGHGGDCICFSYDDNYVLKLCVKRNKSSFDTLKNKSDEANNNKINLAHVTELVFQDEIVYMYKQIKCSIMTEVTFENLINMFDIWINMIDHDFISHDVYFRNFGYYKNTLYMFDFHEEIVGRVGHFDMSNMIINILCCFKIPDYNVFLTGVRKEIESYEATDFLFNNQVPHGITEILRLLNKLRKISGRAEYVQVKKDVMPVIRSALKCLALKAQINNEITVNKSLE